jgi:cytochrome c
MKIKTIDVLAGSLCFALMALTPARAAVDAAAAEELMEANKCFKCHALEKNGKGPSLKKIAAKYKGKPEGEEKAIKNMTEGKKVKLDDGTEEEHKIIKTRDSAKLKNVAQWILAR